MWYTCGWIEKVSSIKAEQDKQKAKDAKKQATANKGKRTKRNTCRRQRCWDGGFFVIVLLQSPYYSFSSLQLPLLSSQSLYSFGSHTLITWWLDFDRCVCHYLNFIYVMLSIYSRHPFIFIFIFCSYKEAVLSQTSLKNVYWIVAAGVTNSANVCGIHHKSIITISIGWARQTIIAFG